GKLIGHDTQVPPRSVGTAAVVPKGQHFGRRHLLAAGAERTKFLANNRRTLEPEIAGALPPFRRNDHPATGDRVFSELRHLICLRARFPHPPPSQMTGSVPDSPVSHLVRRGRRQAARTLRDWPAAANHSVSPRPRRR